MRPVISLGTKKTLDHEVHPMHSTNDNAYGAFPPFSNKLGSKWLKKFLVGTIIVKIFFFNALTFVVMVTFSACVQLE